MALAWLRFCSTIPLLFIGTHYTSSFIPSLFLPWALLMGAMDESPASPPWRGDGRTGLSSCRDVWQRDRRLWLRATLPGRRTELSPHRGAKSHASLHAIDLAEDFRGVFFYLFYILPVSPRCELWGSRIRFRIMVLTLGAFFFSALHVVCFGMLSPHINNRVPKLIHHASTENDDKITSGLRLTIFWCRIYYSVHLKQSTEVT